MLTQGDDAEDDISVASRTILGIVPTSTREVGLALPTRGQIAETSPRGGRVGFAVAEVCDVAHAIGDGGVRSIVNGDRTNLRRTNLLGCLRSAALVQEKDDGGPVIPRKVMSYWINALLPAVGVLATPCC